MDKVLSELLGGKNALAVYRARTDVIGRANVIIRALSLLVEAMSAPATPVRFFLIEVARSRLAIRVALISTITLAPPHSP